ncbi:unnamed protein product [Lepidochelys kempii]
MYVWLWALTWTSALGGWDKNTFLQLAQNLTNAWNVSDCWVCSHFSSHSLQGFPILPVPALLNSWQNGLAWYGQKGKRGRGPIDFRTWIPNHRPDLLVKAPLCVEKRSLRTRGKTTLGKYPKTHCEKILILGNNASTTLLLYPNGTEVANYARAGGYVGYILRENATQFAGLTLWKWGGIGPNPDDAASLVGRLQEVSQNSGGNKGNYSIVLGDHHLWWVCGSWAGKTLPPRWLGRCTVAFAWPGGMHRRDLIEIRDTTRRTRRDTSYNPIVEEGSTGMRTFRILFPWVGVGQLEYALKNMSAEMEIFTNATRDAIQALQEEISSLAHYSMQNRLALDQLLSAQGGVCTFLNATCCLCVNQSGRIVTDTNIIANVSAFFHKQASISPSVGFDLWGWLTSWLPNFGWLKTLFVYGVGFLMIVGLLFCCASSCCALFHRVCTKTMSPAKILYVKKGGVNQDEKHMNMLNNE